MKTNYTIFLLFLFVTILVPSCVLNEQEEGPVYIITGHIDLPTNSEGTVAPAAALFYVASADSWDSDSLRSLEHYTKASIDSNGDFTVYLYGVKPNHNLFFSFSLPFAQYQKIAIKKVDGNNSEIDLGFMSAGYHNIGYDFSSNMLFFRPEN